MAAGYYGASFQCDYDHAELLVRVLEKKFPTLVEPGSYYGGRLRYTIHLDVMDDRLCAELMVRRELEKAIARHRPPTDPPPDEAA